MSTSHTRKVSLPDIVSRVDRLPQLPEVALRLSKMLEDPDVNAEQLAEVIRMDPDMTTQVLRLCNSAAYGLSRKISTVKEAVAILGLNTLRSMVYVIISKFALDRPNEGYGLERGALWYNALTCAVYAKFLAEKHGRVDPELAFTGALLRNIGKIILGEFVGPSYQFIEEQAQQGKMSFVEAEREVLGFSHADVGKRIAEKWNLPERLIKVIQYYHQPSALAEKGGTPDEVRFVTIVHLADAFTLMVGSGVGSDGLMYSLDTSALDAAGIKMDVEYLESTMARLVDLNHIVEDMAESLKGMG